MENNAIVNILKLTNSEDETVYVNVNLITHIIPVEYEYVYQSDVYLLGRKKPLNIKETALDIMRAIDRKENA